MAIRQTMTASGDGSNLTFEELMDFALNLQATLPEGVSYSDVDVKLETWRGSGNDGYGAVGPGWKITVTW